MQIIIRTLTGTRINMDVDQEEPIITVKKKIEAKEGIPPNQQRLFYKTQHLKNGKTLLDYNIKEHYMLQLKAVMECKSSIQIFVKNLSGRIKLVEVKATDLIEDVKKKIEDIEKIPYDQQCLMFAGQQLRDEFTVKEYSIKRESILELHFLDTLEAGIQILVKTLTGTTLLVDVNPNERVEIVKAKIYNKINFPPDQQRLVYIRNTLENGKKLSDYNIGQESRLNLFHYFSHSSRMQIFVRTEIGHIISLEVRKITYIEQVKERIQEKEDIPAHRQRLMLGQQTLEDGFRIGHYNIKQDSMLTLGGMPRERVVKQISIKTLNGKIIKVKLNPMDTVKTLKEKIQEEEGIPPHQQVLIFVDKELQDHEIFSDYDPHQTLTLHSTFRLRGGM